ncbi:MAG: carboxypeptidase-like regulatory domain-containing protein [Planctomycetota bacterium]
MALPLLAACIALLQSPPTETASPPPVVTVVDPSGEPVGGADVIVVGSHWLHTTIGHTDAAGRFQLPPAKETRSLTARGPRHSFADLVDVAADATDDVRLVVGSSAGSARVRVVDADGKPVDDAWVTFEMLTEGTAGSYGSFGRPSWWVATDPKGQFRAHGLPPGPLSMHVHAHALPLAPTKVTIGVVAGEEVEATVRLQPSPVLAGRVFDPDGAPAPATLHVIAPSHYTMFFADDAGRFRLTQVPREKFKLRVEPRVDGQAAREIEVDASSGEPITLEVRLEREPKATKPRRR